MDFSPLLEQAQHRIKEQFRPTIIQHINTLTPTSRQSQHFYTG